MANSLSPWKQSKHLDKEQKPEVSGGKFFGNRFTPTIEPVPVHFIRPENLYIDAKSGLGFGWRRGRRHWVQSAGMYIECGMEACLVCAYGNPQEFGFDAKADSELAKSRAKLYCAVTMVIEAWHHLVTIEKKDKTGTYVSREICGVKNCEHCKAGLPKVWGKKVYYQFAQPQWEIVIEPLMEKVNRFCKCGGYLLATHYSCGKCDNTLIDVTDTCPNCGPDFDLEIDKANHRVTCSKCSANWTLLEHDNKEMNENANSLHECPKCGNRDYPVLHTQCVTGKENCPGEPYDIFDVQFNIKKTKDEKQYTLEIPSWKLAPIDPKFFDPKFQGEGDAAEKIAARNKEALPLETILKPELPHVVARDIHRANLFSAKQPEGTEGAKYAER